MALAAIYQALPEDVLLMVAEKDSAKEAWETLKTMHVVVERVKEAKVQTLRTHFEATRMKDGETVDDFSMKLTSIVTGIRSLGEKVEEISVVKKFLRVVPQKYMQIVTVIEQFGDLKNMTVEEVVGRLKVHEERLHGYEDREEEKHLLLTHEEWKSRMKKNKETVCFSSSSSRNGNGGDSRGREKGRGQGRGRGLGRGDSSSRQEDTKPRKNKSTVKCYACQKYGHYASECRNKKPDEEANLTNLHDDEPTLMFVEGVANPFPEDEETNLEEFVQQPSKEEPEVLLLNEEKVMAILLSSGEEYNHTNVWYLDNGASNHMTGHREKFNELDEKITGKVKFRDGSFVDIKGRGSI
ncbi:uncharacterized protein LOC124912946 [Impatiens glandulifera]|uniref:uncharacterized protein LOC124912946 n=1 Tax=Impatiens glandulifera TaxID=253017 RepID=UPI001FB10757|nr:uncharacterized protein LOC124912946 [Impatiens glandulifera]